MLAVGNLGPFADSTSNNFIYTTTVGTSTAGNTTFVPQQVGLQQLPPQPILPTIPAPPAFQPVPALPEANPSLAWLDRRIDEVRDCWKQAA